MANSVRNTVIISAIIASSLTATLTIWLMNSKDSKTCKTKECIDAASYILNSMDKTVDPCNDFYRYACGGWIKDHPVPDDKSAISIVNSIIDRNYEALKDLLKTNYSNDRDGIKIAKIFYRSCMNEEAVEAQGAQPALDMIKKFGGLPLFGDSFNDKDFNLEKHLAETMISRNSPIVKMYVDRDDKNSSANVIILDQPKLVLPDRSYYLDESLRNSTMPAYRKFMHDYLALLWKSRDTANGSSYGEKKLSMTVEDIVQFETDLAEIMMTKEDRMVVVKLYNKMSLKDMTKKVTDDFKWYKFVRRVMKRVNIKISPTTEVVVYGIPYLSKFMNVIEKYDKSVIKNYVLWYHLQNRVDLLGKKFRDTQVPYRKATSGTSVEKPRYQTCVKNANTHLPMPVGAIYVKEMFSEDSKKVMRTMISNVIQAFKNNLRSIEWMDEETKNEAEKKADTIVQLTGYPDYILDEKDPKLDEDHKLSEDDNVTEETYFKSTQAVIVLGFKNQLKKLNKPMKRDDWSGVGPAVVNAYYHENQNAMVFPAAFLQPPIYDVGYTFAKNYGAIGHVAGHELIHGFDVSGSQFDGFGNLKNWWTNFSRMNFEERSDCMRKQYSGFFYETAGLYVNGNFTLPENTADNGGLRLAFEAYQLWKKDNVDKELKLPGLEDFTPEQLFFLGTPQKNCAVERPEFAREQIATDDHAPWEIRNRGTVMNYEKFGEAFNCKRGKDKMFPEPEDTCRVW